MIRLSKLARSDIALPVLGTSEVLKQPSLSAILPLHLDSLHRPDVAGVPSSQRVLVAEDNNDLREIMSIFLSQEGYTVIACCDAQLASEAFRSDPFIDILMTDLEMPGRSGLELARELTTLRPSLPVMILSGAYITSEMSDEMKGRDWKYLSKPCGLPTILHVLQSLHSKRPSLQREVFYTGAEKEAYRTGCGSKPDLPGFGQPHVPGKRRRSHS